MTVQDAVDRLKRLPVDARTRELNRVLRKDLNLNATLVTELRLQAVWPQGVEV